MKFGFVISLWVLLCPLFSQNCEEMAMGSVQYAEEIGQESRKITSFFVPCNETAAISYTLPSIKTLNFEDPDPTTDAGIILVLLQSNPGRPVITETEFLQLLYRDLRDQPVYFSESSGSIPVSDLTGLGNLQNDFVLMPVLVTNMSSMDPAGWFEGECVFINPSQSLTIIEKPVKEYEFIHFDEITFTNWPDEVPISDYFDFTFTDQKTDQEIPHTATDNRSFRLSFPQSVGLFRFAVTWKNHDCEMLELGISWEFPTVGISMDTVPGFRNIDKCVPVRVFQFESVTAFEISLAWDQDSLDFTAIKNIHPLLEGQISVSDIMASDKNEILLRFQSEDPVTLADSTILFEWCGKALADAGTLVKMGYSSGQEKDTKISIQGFETENITSSGGIAVQEDREINYDLNQLCNNRDGGRRIELDIINAEAYPYTYTFHSSAIRDSVIRSVPFLISDVPPGQYEFTIRDSFGFEITETIVVQERVPPGFEVAVDPGRVQHPTCLNPFGGRIGLIATPAGPHYRFDLLNDDAVFQGDTVTGLVAGTYIIETENEQGCIDTLHYRIKEPQKLHVSWDTDLILCPGDTRIDFRITNDDPLYEGLIQYQIDGGPVLTVDKDSLGLDKSGRYEVQLWNDDGCTLDTAFSVLSAPPAIDLWDTTTLAIYQGDTLSFVLPEMENLTEVGWRYNGIGIGNDRNLQYQPTESGLLYYEASVYDRCYYTDTLMVHIILPEQDPESYDFPNAFSPNGDGINDLYIIRPTRDIQRIERLEIYDRYGNFVFIKNYTDDTGSVPAGWDGHHAGVEAPPGIYAVQIDVLLFGGRKERMGLDLLLIR